MMLSDCESFSAAREQIHHEDELINHRLSWFMLAQAVLFAGYVHTDKLAPPQRMLDVMLALGLAMCVLIIAGVFPAIFKIWECALLYKEHAGGHPTLWRPDSIHISGLAAPALIPVTFLAAWLFLLSEITPRFWVTCAAIGAFVIVLVSWYAIDVRRDVRRHNRPEPPDEQAATPYPVGS